MYNQIIDLITDKDWKKVIKEYGWIVMILTFIVLAAIIIILSICAAWLWGFVFVPMGLPAMSWVQMLALQIFLSIIWPKNGGGKV